MQKKNLLTGYLVGFLICSASSYLPETPSQGWLDPPHQSPSWKCLPTNLLEVFPHPRFPPPYDANRVKLTKIQPAPRSFWIPRVYETLCTYLLTHHTWWTERVWERPSGVHLSKRLRKSIFTLPKIKHIARWGISKKQELEVPTSLMFLMLRFKKLGKIVFCRGAQPLLAT